MPIKKKSKVNAEFNMSSLTDIIFLLLIFFMLTSSMITPNALNLQLPGKKRTPSTSNSSPTRIEIKDTRQVLLNGGSITFSNLEREIRQLRRDKGANAVVSITPDRLANNEDVVRVLDIAYRMQVKTSLNDPR